MIFLRIAGTIIGLYAAIRLGGVGIAWVREGIEHLKPPKN